MDTVRREYRLKTWVQGYYLALGALITVLGAHIFSNSLDEANWDSLKPCCDFFITAGFAVLGCYFIVLALRSRIVLEGTRIAVRYAMRMKSADLSEILGYRTYAIQKMSFLHLKKHIPFWHLQLRESGDYISIMQLFRVDNYFHSWLQQLPDLDNRSLLL